MCVCVVCATSVVNFASQFYIYIYSTCARVVVARCIFGSRARARNGEYQGGGRQMVCEWGATAGASTILVFLCGVLNSANKSGENRCVMHY